MKSIPAIVLTLILFFCATSCGRPSDAPSDELARSIIKAWWEHLANGNKSYTVKELKYTGSEQKDSQKYPRYIFTATGSYDDDTPEKGAGAVFRYYFWNDPNTSGIKDGWEIGMEKAE